jgi:hypothetical protein
MTSEVIKLWKKFIKGRGLPAYLTLLVFLYIFSKIAHTWIPVIPQEAFFISTIVMGTINSKYNFLKAVINDLEKIPPKGHYIFLLIAAVPYVIYLLWKLNIVLWLQSSFRRLFSQVHKFAEQIN